MHVLGVHMHTRACTNVPMPTPMDMHPRACTCTKMSTRSSLGMRFTSRSTDASFTPCDLAAPPPPPPLPPSGPAGCSTPSSLTEITHEGRAWALHAG